MLTKVIVKNKMSRFFMVHCVVSKNDMTTNATGQFECDSGVRTTSSLRLIRLHTERFLLACLLVGLNNNSNRERRPRTVRSPPLTCFFPLAVETLGALSDEAHSLIAEIGRRATLCTADPRDVPVPTYSYFSGNSEFQRSVPCQHVHSFRVPIVTIPDIHFYFC